MASQKEQKEAFVTGYDGTSPFELLFIGVVVPVTSFGLYQAIIAASSTTTSGQHQRQQSMPKQQVVCLEVGIFFVPMILSQTHWIYPWGVSFVMIQVLMTIFFLSRRKTTTDKRIVSGPPQTTAKATKTSTTTESSSSSQKCGYMTVFRSTGLVLTFLAILAVDFRLFPRRFVKTETHGYGLMDLGASFSMLTAGLFSNYSRRAQQQRRSGSGDSKRNNNEAATTTTTTIGTNDIIWKWTMRTLPLLTIGFIRLLVHKGLEYQEHVSEYGVHWNFFFTFAVVPVLSQLLRTLGRKINMPAWILAALLLILYQHTLSTLGLQDWIEDAPRGCPEEWPLHYYLPSHSLCQVIHANREGILGCIGYMALYLFGAWMGQVLIWTPTPVPLKQVWLWVLSWTSAWLTLISVLDIQVSRRSTNASFVCWTMVVNSLAVACFRTVDNFFVSQHCQDKKKPTTSRVPLILDAINRHGLVCFLVSNLLTGLVNISINTLEASKAMALTVLVLYLSAVSGVALVLDAVLATLARKRVNESKTTTRSKTE